MASIHVPEAGDVIAGDVELVRKVAKGGFGAVWEGVQRQVGRRVAIKFLHPAAAADELVVRRFRREAKALCRMRHPGVVTVFLFGVTQPDIEGMLGVPYLVMEYVEGRTLRAALKESPDPRLASEAVQLIAQILEALAEAHRNKIVHRDLKPHNILLEPTPRKGEVAKLIDFGIAKNLRSDASDGMLTQTGYMYGTPGYMAPEMIEGKEPSPSVDVYATGVLLYRLLTGRMPFSGDSPLAVLMAHVGTPAPPLGPPYEGHALEQVVLGALAKDPADRYPDAEALLDALDGVPPASYEGLRAPPLDEEARTRVDIEVMSGEWDLTAVTPNPLFTGEREAIEVGETNRVSYVPDDPVRRHVEEEREETQEVQLEDLLEVTPIESAEPRAAVESTDDGLLQGTAEPDASLEVRDAPGSARSSQRSTVFALLLLLMGFGLLFAAATLGLLLLFVVL